MADMESTQRDGLGDVKRWVAVAAGGGLTIYGLSRRSLGGVALAVAGGGLLARGLLGGQGGAESVDDEWETGRERRQAAAQEAGAVHVEKAITIEKSPAELYQFWRDFENLPRFMDNLESVTMAGDGRSHWVAKAPLGSHVEWDAEVTADEPNERIAWSSVAEADVQNAGEVRFVPAPGDRGTEVHVRLDYKPPGGKAGAMVAKLFGDEPGQQVGDDLRRLKQMLEAGEVATTAGQPSGRPM
ncbi:MAG TPA: SRPBCC family protein [Chloroflexia bacterium]